MLNFLNGKKIQKEVALPFEVILEAQEDGSFLATCPTLPGCTAHGRTKSEALQNISQAMRNFMDRTGQRRFERVLQEPGHPSLHALCEFDGKLLAGTNRDGLWATASGNFGTWVSHAVAGDTTPAAPRRGTRASDGEEEDSELVDFTPQVYCLAPFTHAGATRLYAGTSASGAVYESVDGVQWDPSYATGEARVHALASFKNGLYAGTSAGGKLFRTNGRSWELACRTGQGAVTALAEFNGELFLGTYPSGLILASGDGVQWPQVFDSGQTFVRALAVFEGHLFAATSKSTGGILFRSADGRRWEKVFESRDPNFYCLAEFHHALWLGTGSGGRLYRSADGLQWAVEQTFDEEGVRSLAVFDGRLYAGTDTSGSVYRTTFASTAPPQISDLKVTAVTSHSALVTWKTDRPSDSQVRYGLTQEYDCSVQLGAPVSEHHVPLSSLQEMTTYRFKVLSRSSDGSEAGFSEDLSFTTAALGEVAIASTTHPDEARWYHEPRVVLTWHGPPQLARFHTCLDQVPNTEPQPGGPGVVSTTEHSAVFEDLPSGQWWFHLLAEDRSGNVALQAVRFSVRVDREVAPPVRLHSPSHPKPGSWYHQPEAVFAWEAPEDLSGIAGYLAVVDQDPDTVPGPLQARLLAEPRMEVKLESDGEWFAHVVCVDKAGNTGTKPSRCSVRLDTAALPPVLACASHPDPGRWVNSSRAEFSWAPPPDDSGIAGYYFLLDQDEATVPDASTGRYVSSDRVSIQVPADGQWYFHVVSADRAGNVGTRAAHGGLRVDTWAEPPLIRCVSHPEGAWSNSTKASFQLEAPADFSGITGYHLTLDRESQSVPPADKENFTTDTTLDYAGLEDGTWYLHALSRDEAGNVGVKASHGMVRVDTQAAPPRVRSSSHPEPEAWSRQAVIEVEWDEPADLSGIECYYACLDRDAATVPTPAAAQRTVERALTFGPKEEGIWYFHVVSQDKAGNLGRQAGHYRFQIDTQALPPRLFCSTHKDRKAWSSLTTARFEWADPEDYSGIAGYYYSWDRSADTVPGPSTGRHTVERKASLEPGLDEDGDWYFHVTSVDKAGNVGKAAAHYPLHIDTSALPPVITSGTHPNRQAWNSQASPAFSWAAPQDLSGIAGYYTLLDQEPLTVPTAATGNWTEEPKATFNGLADGSWTLHVISKDKCGNLSAQAGHYTVRIDTQALPPEAVSTTHPRDVWLADTNPVFTWTPPSDLSGIVGYYTLLDRESGTVPSKEKGQFTTAVSTGYQKLEDGRWYFHIVSVDQAGNVGTRATHVAVQVDATAQPPAIRSLTHPAGTWSSKAAPQFSWDAPRDPSGMQGYFYLVDQSPATVPGPGAAFTALTHVTLDPLPDGEWIFHVASKDGTGNLSQEAAHHAFKIDTTVPAPRLQSRSHPDQEAWSAANRPQFVWDDGEDLSGIACHYWTFDQQAGSPVILSAATQAKIKSAVLPPQKDGLWYFHLAARDNAGNVSETVHWKVLIETVAPVSRLEPLPEFTRSDIFEVRWKGEDQVSGLLDYDVQVRQGPQGNWQDWQVHTRETSAAYRTTDGVQAQFRVRARDRAGNVEAWPEGGSFVSTLVDLSAPEPVTELAVKPAPAGALSLSWKASRDSGSGLAGYRVYRSSEPGTPGQPLAAGLLTACQVQDEGRDLEDGKPYWYTVRAVDKAGNEQLEGNAQVEGVCDRSALPPEVTCLSHPDVEAWYQGRRPLLEWTVPPDSSGVEGYLYCVDQSAGTIPPAGATFTRENRLEVPELGDGTWYFHVVTRDLAGNVGTQAAHARFNIDTLPPPPPVLRCLSHPAETWSQSDAARFEWDPPADPAGIQGYFTALNADPDYVPGPDRGGWTEGTSQVVGGLPEGVSYFHVAAQDRAKNDGTQASHVRLRVARTPPPPEIASATHPDSTRAYALPDASFTWTAPAYSQAISAYHYVLDSNPGTVPDASAQRSEESGAAFANLPDGSWWLHVVSVDGQGQCGTLASHFHFTVSSRAPLSGQLTQANGVAPAAGVPLEISRGGQVVASLNTDPQGKFVFESLPLGSYDLKVAAVNLPEQVFEAVEVKPDTPPLLLSCEICALPNPAPAGTAVRFSLLARGKGILTLKVYTESGKAAHQVDQPVDSPHYVDLAWATQGVAPGNYMFQCLLKTEAGILLKTPLRKLKIS